jgi:hypothetical protein
MSQGEIVEIWAVKSIWEGVLSDKKWDEIDDQKCLFQ